MQLKPSSSDEDNEMSQDEPASDLLSNSDLIGSESEEIQQDNVQVVEKKAAQESEACVKDFSKEI